MKKSFSIKTILGNLVFINEENKSKEFQGKNVLSFKKFVLGGFCPGGFCLGGFLSGLFCPVTDAHSDDQAVTGNQGYFED